jgi:hypothetical protein
VLYIAIFQFSCCGVDNYKDFSPGVWNTTPIAEITHAHAHLDTPLMCCTEKERSKSAANWWRCATQPFDSTKSNYMIVSYSYVSFDKQYVGLYG